MNEELLMKLMQAHRIGVEDAKAALKLVLDAFPLTSAQVTDIIARLNRTVILPTRVYKEILQPELTK